MLHTAVVQNAGGIQQLNQAEVYLAVNSSPHGLTGREAATRLLEIGPNELKKSEAPPFYRRFIRQFTHYLAILLWIAAFLSFLSEYMQPHQGMLSLGIAIIAVIFINATFTFVQEYRAEKSIEALQKLLPFRVIAIRDGVEQEVTANVIVPGDVIRLQEGDMVPADCRVLSSFSLTVNNACLTGESEPWSLEAGPCFEPALRSKNLAFAGTNIVTGHGTCVVYATGMDTEFGRIAKLTAAVQESLTPLQKEITRVTKIVSLIATVMGVLFFLLGYILGRTFWQNFLFAIGIIVANVPEGLLPTLTLSLAMAGQRIAKKKAVVKSLNSVETLGCVTVICTDKTGTLTENRMAVRKVWFGNGIVNVDSAPVPDQAKELLKTAHYCSKAEQINGSFRGDPSDVAILETTSQIGILNVPAVTEFPFDPERKRITSVRQIGPVLRAFTKGAPERIIEICDRARFGPNTVQFGVSERETIQAASESMMQYGLRVFALSTKEMEPGLRLDPMDQIESGMVFQGLIGLEDPPRKEVPEAIQKCRQAGIKVIMITGDAAGTATAIARQIGLCNAQPFTMSGEDIDSTDNERLKDHLRKQEIVFYRATPAHKLRIVSLLKTMGEIVAVTGDGVNDAPALKKADIGIAMGRSGTDVAKEAADLILLDDNFSTIVNAIEEGRGVYDNIKKFMSYILSSNVPEIVPYLAYVLLRIPLPLTIMQILAVDLGTDMFPALALGAERPTDDLMKRPPRKRSDKILNFKLFSRAYLFLGLIESYAAMYAFFYLLNRSGWKYGEMLPATDPVYLQATTACLAAIIVTQVGNVLASRNFRKSLLSIGIFSNRLVLMGIGIEVLILLWIVYHPWGNFVFSTHPFSTETWLMLAPFAFVLLFADEIRKWIVSRQRAESK